MIGIDAYGGNGTAVARRRLGGAGPNRFDRLGLAVFDTYKKNELVMVQLKAVSLMGMNKEI